MMRKLLSVLLVVMVLVCAMPLAASAEVTPPNTFGAPEHFGASLYYNDSVYFTFSASEDLRNYIEKWKADDPNNNGGLTMRFQIDYRIDSGNWHHTPDWDSPKTVPDGIDDMYFVFGYQNKYNSNERWTMTGLFPEDEALKAFQESGWDYLKSHSITFRARFANSFDYGETFVLSPWSREFTLSANIKEDYNKLINHAPSLVSAELKARPSGEPYFHVKLGRIPGDIQDLHALSGSTVRTEIWMRRAGDKDFKYIHYEWANEEAIDIDARDYFSVDGTKQSYDAESYEIKVRYALDLREYKQSGFSDSTSNVDIYGPFSNVISNNMPAWSNASSWANADLSKANDYGMITDRLKGADMTKPITREEFAEIAVRFYEMVTGKVAAPHPSQTFKDTSNPEILKALNLQITFGVGDGTKFEPQSTLIRQQMAAMITRTLKACYSDIVFDVTGQPDFKDQKGFASYAIEPAKFMAKYGITVGDGKGNFSPNDVCSREQAIAFLIRAFDKIDTIRASSPAVPNGSVNGTWVLGNLSGGKFNAVSGKYEGGASGLGQIYNFKSDGTYTALVIWSNAMFFTGKYSIKGDVLTATERYVEESNDDGKTWGAKEALPNSSAYFTTGTDATGKYLLLGQEGATPPLVDRKNALKYSFKE